MNQANYHGFDLVAFREWLISYYRVSTTDTTIKATRQLLDAYAVNDQTPPQRLMWAARRVQKFASDGGYVNRSIMAYVERVANYPYPSTKRQKEAVSIRPVEWARLINVLTANHAELEAAVAHVMVDTALRVGDVFRIKKASLINTYETAAPIMIEVKGGAKREFLFESAPDAWKHLLSTWLSVAPKAKTVAEALCNDSETETAQYNCAAKRMERALKRYAAEAKVSGRIFTHRLRRTVLVNALGVTKDLQAVQQLGGHSSIATTMKYTDEARPHAVAGLLIQLRENRKGPKK